MYSKPAGSTATDGTTIEAAMFNTLMDDIVSDLNVDRPVTAGGTGSSTAAAARTALGIKTAIKAIDTTGSANAYLLTTSDSLTPSDGDAVIIVASFANTGAATIDVDSTGAVDIKKVVAGTVTALATGDIYDNAHYLLTYDSSASTWIITNQDLALYAKLAGPAFTGNPTAPTQSFGNSSTRLATTAFVQGEFGSVVAKTADEAVNSSTTLQDDDHLFFAMAANTTYFVMVHLLEVTIVTNPQLKVGWTVPSGCTLRWSQDWTSSSTDLKTESETLTFPVAATGTHGVKFRAIVKNGANAGNLQMQWAQDTSNGNDTTLLKHSNMIVHKLGAT